MGVLIDFSSYARCEKNCLTCKNTVSDDFLNLPVCTSYLSEYRGQVVNDEIVCDCYIRKDKNGDTLQA